MGSPACGRRQRPRTVSGPHWRFPRKSLMDGLMKSGSDMSPSTSEYPSIQVTRYAKTNPPCVSRPTAGPAGAILGHGPQWKNRGRGGPGSIDLQVVPVVCKKKTRDGKKGNNGARHDTETCTLDAGPTLLESTSFRGGSSLGRGYLAWSPGSNWMGTQASLHHATF